MNIILLGAPGAGKGTQALFIAEKFSIAQIATGEMFRNAVKSPTELGQKIKEMMESGQLIPDNLTISLVQQRIAEPDCKNGFLLDGFPRTIAQADALEEFGIKIDLVIEFDVPDSVIMKRMSGRRIHAESGRIYNIYFNPPKVEGIDDVTGEKLITRSDDDPETVQNRLKIYHSQTKPLVEYYQNKAKEGKVKFHKLNGDQSVDQIKAELENLLNSF